MNKKKILAFSTIFIMTIIAVKVTGYDFSSPGWRVGEKAFEEKNVRLCSKIINTSIFGPSTAMRRAQCIRRYAELAKDPSPCELLMPSSLAFSCLGEAQATAHACSFDYGKNVAWRLGDEVNDPWENATIEECKNDKNLSTQGQKCCYIFQLNKEPKADACSRFAGEEKFMNTCLAELATKKKDAALCEEITDDNKRMICELRAKYTD